MVVGIGIDLVNVDKMGRAVEKRGRGFIDKIFDPGEISHLRPGKMYNQRLAARFAAKEAVFKAVCSSLPLALKDILIFNRENGAPYCVLKKKTDLEILISITHLDKYAAATAIAQTKP